jgi:type I restriction enzyme S subunit
MKYLKITLKHLAKEGRFDFDYHDPPKLIAEYPRERLVRLDKLVEFKKLKRDPTKAAETEFEYVDISSVDINAGEIAGTQTLVGSEAPSRARKVIVAHDVIVSTVRPTRKAVAVVPVELHGQICSTGFVVLSPKPNVNPYYLLFVLRLDSTVEQLRKFSTGSSYPAILDSDLKKTLVPFVDTEEQDAIAYRLLSAMYSRKEALNALNKLWLMEMDGLVTGLKKTKKIKVDNGAKKDAFLWQAATLQALRESLKQVDGTDTTDDEGELEFDMEDAEAVEE